MTLPRLRLRVSAVAESKLRNGHPWLFAQSIQEQNREGQTGELAIIYDRKDRFLAAGLFDPESPIRVRILHADKPQTIDHTWWSEKLARAIAQRQGLFDANTTGFRWINGESDGWPGLILDRYAETLVLKLYTSAWQPRLKEVVDLIREKLNPARIVLRLSRNIQDSFKRVANSTDGSVLYGPPVSDQIIFLESGLRFESEVVRGQKTGFFLDQRENRRLVGTLSSGRSMLNVFSFTGGFSVYAACNGALKITNLDISSHALAGAKRNYELNHAIPNVAQCSSKYVQADAFEWLVSNPQSKFGLIVLDPPSLAKRESERERAIGAYERLASMALNHLQTRGILVACSCSAHVSATEFFEVVQRSAKKSGRKFEEIARTGHAPDHPATFAEAEYLKGIFLRFL